MAAAHFSTKEASARTPSSTPSTTRALVFDGSSVRLENSHPLTIAGPGDAIIRMAKAAVSGTDLEICKGLLSFKGVLGRQFVGIVESVNGPDSGRLAGKRVVGSIAALCGKCDMCVAGLSSHCRHRTVLGMSGRDGCLADRFVMPAKNLTVVPDSVDNDHAVFAVELAAAIHAAEQLTIIGKPYITVLGDGSLGLLTAQVMAKLNASVRLVGRYSEKLTICEKWGIKHRHVDDVGRRADQDIVVDCTGSPQGLELAMQLVRPRGKIVLKSIYAPATVAVMKAVDLTPIVLNELEIIGSFFGSVGAALTMLDRREIDVLSLISKRLNLSDGTAILKAAGLPGVVKVLVDS